MYKWKKCTMQWLWQSTCVCRCVFNLHLNMLYFLKIWYDQVVHSIILYIFISYQTSYSLLAKKLAIYFGFCVVINNSHECTFWAKFFFLCLNSNRHYFWRSTATELRKWLWDVWIWFKIVFEHFQNMHWSIEEFRWCKNGLSDDFGPTFTKPPNYLLSCNVTVAKWIASCSQHIVLVIWIEFPPKLCQVTLLLARKEKLPKCQETPIISAGGKKQFCCCPWWMWLKKKKIANLTCSNGLPRQERLFQKLFTLQNGKFCFTSNSQLSHLFRLATPSLPGFAS